jgi:hypothetical protein
MRIMPTSDPPTYGLALIAVIRPLFLLLGLFVVYNVNLRQVSSDDTYASRFVPISVLRDGDLILDEFVPPYIREGGPDRLTDNFIFVRGHYYDSHPPIGPLLAVPVYALPVWAGVPESPQLVANLFSKVAASIMTALSALLIFGAVRRLVAEIGKPDRAEAVAMAAALAYGVCTSVWSTASLALWSHTPAVLGYAFAIWALTSGWTGTAGLAAMASAMSRPATLPAAGIIVLFTLHRAFRHKTGDAWLAAVRCAAAAGITAAAALVYNLWLLGDPLGGARLRTEVWIREFNTSRMFSGSLIDGLAGLTVSPSYGLLIFSPIVVIAIRGAIKAWQKAPTSDARLLIRYVSLAALVILLTYSKFIVWWGGHGFGPRYLTDAMPFVGVLFGVGFAAIGVPRARLGQAGLAALLVYSASIQAIGAFCWPSPWTLRKNPPPHLRLWDWHDNQILSSIRSGPRIDPTARRLLARVWPARGDSGEDESKSRQE